MSTAWKVLVGAATLLGALLMLQASPAAAQADERRAKIQAEMEEALRRRQEILERILAIGSGLEAPFRQSLNEAESLEVHRARRAEPLAEPPLDAFDQGIAAGPWPWSDELLLLEWTLDLDADGRPEEIRYLHPDSATLLRRHVDRNLDGRIDSWITYRDGELFQQELDDDHDGRRDAREQYVDGVLSWREVDRDQDGAMDVRRIYRNDWLAEEHFDPDNDGVPDIIVLYRDGDVQERHHDVDGDGEIDVVSFYSDGRLLRRELRSTEVEIDSLLAP
jgi:hypothetical protein